MTIASASATTSSRIVSCQRGSCFLRGFSNSTDPSERSVVTW